MGPQLDLDLVEPPLVVTCLGIDDAELVGGKLAFVIGVEDLHVTTGLGSSVPSMALRKWINNPRLSSAPSRALNTQSILGSMGWRIARV
jgi:hypothetical protein